MRRVTRSTSASSAASTASVRERKHDHEPQRDADRVRAPGRRPCWLRSSDHGRVADRHAAALGAERHSLASEVRKRDGGRGRPVQPAPASRWISCGSPTPRCCSMSPIDLGQTGTELLPCRLRRRPTMCSRCPVRWSSVRRLVSGRFGAQLVDGSCSAAAARSRSRWCAAIALDYGWLVGAGVSGWHVHADQFAERHGLIVLIALASRSSPSAWAPRASTSARRSSWEPC